MASTYHLSQQPKHEVFLSFRGDTRYNFASHLLQALKEKGIGVFFDEKELEMGDELSPTLLGAIASSRISIVIISKEYASSSWCLIELSEIMKRYFEGSQLVVPIFYHVNPSDVRKHSGTFEKPFVDYERNKSNELVKKWKAAFAQVGNLKGSHIIGDRSEPEEIKKIVAQVTMKLGRNSTSYSEGLVGIDDRKKKIKSMLRIGNESYYVIGIWGMCGIGKTTLSEVVYNELFAQFDNFFDGFYFLCNVREKFQKEDGIKLRDQLLSKIFNEPNFHIATPRIGSKFIMDRLSRKRVLLVLDDVSDLDQFQSLVCSHNHFGPGSRIIITSRDKQVLNNCGVHEIYEVKQLYYGDSVQLFSLYAFKHNRPIDGFKDLSDRVLQYTRGVPIALKVLGSTLYLKNKDYWESVLNKLKNEGPEEKIQNLLKISYDGLDDTEKKIFLDIAIFFNLNNANSVKEILNSCYDGVACCGVENLVDKCLVCFSMDRIQVHDLLQAMAKDIVCKESKDPRNRSRLWNPKDVRAVFENDEGTKSIEGIMLDMSQSDKKIKLSPTFSKEMMSLRILKIYSSFYGESEKHSKMLIPANYKIPPFLPDEIRCLWWDYYSWKMWPLKFNPKNLVELRLNYGKMRQLWKGDNQDLVNLRILDLGNCKKLRKIPNLLGATKLEELNCYGCSSLEELPSLKHLTSLKKLGLFRNYKLKKFPEIPRDFRTELFLSGTQITEVPASIEHATQINVLVMTGSKVKKVSANIFKMESLESLSFRECPIVELPSSIGCLSKLLFLNMSNTRIQNLPSSICRLHALSWLNLSKCPIQNLPHNISKLHALQDLYLSGCPIKNLPSNFFKLDALIYLNLSKCPNITEFTVPTSNFKILKYLHIYHCKSLKLLLNLPSSLMCICAYDCPSLEKVSFTSHPIMYSLWGYEYCFSNCFKLNQDSIDHIVAVLKSSTKELVDRLVKGLVEVGEKHLVCMLVGNEILEMFEHQSMNFEINLKIHPNSGLGIRFLVFTLSFVVHFKDCNHIRNGELAFFCEGQLKAKGGCYYKKFSTLFRLYSLHPNGKNMCVLFNPELVHYDDKGYVEASFKFYFKKHGFNLHQYETVIDNIKVEKYGVHLSYVEYNDVNVKEVNGGFRFKHKKKV